MLSEKEKREWDEIDRLAEEHGGYVVRPHPLVIEADYHAMSNYCREKGIKPMDLSEDEYKMFLFDEPLVYA